MKNPTKDPVKDLPKEMKPAEIAERFITNDFKFDTVPLMTCPLAAHIRKTNPRKKESDDSLGIAKNARIVRNGIPYGTDYSDTDKVGPRGLLFACYQSSIENGYQFIQQMWANNVSFPSPNSGLDPFIGQAQRDGSKPGALQVHLFVNDDTRFQPGLGSFAGFVTMKGGEYFFVPSISALTSTLVSTN